MTMPPNLAGADHDRTHHTGDRLPRLRYQLLNGDGTMPDLTGATVVFNMRQRDGVALVTDGAATVVGAAADGVVEYAWAAGDTDTAGTHLAEFQVTFPGGLPATYPNRGYLLVEITADL